MSTPSHSRLFGFTRAPCLSLIGQQPASHSFGTSNNVLIVVAKYRTPLGDGEGAGRALSKDHRDTVFGLANSLHTMARGKPLFPQLGGEASAAQLSRLPSCQGTQPGSRDHGNGPLVVKIVSVLALRTSCLTRRHECNHPWTTTKLEAFQARDTGRVLLWYQLSVCWLAHGLWFAECLCLPHLVAPPLLTSQHDQISPHQEYSTYRGHRVIAELGMHVSLCGEDQSHMHKYEVIEIIWATTVMDPCLGTSTGHASRGVSRFIASPKLTPLPKAGQGLDQYIHTYAK